MASVASSPVGGRPPWRGPNRSAWVTSFDRSWRMTSVDARWAATSPSHASAARPPTTTSSATSNGVEVDQRRATEESAGDTARQQLGLHEHQTRGQHGGRGGEDDEPSRGRCVPQQPRVQWLHRACAPELAAESTTGVVPAFVGATGNPVGAGMSDGLMRRRNTQNVHAW